MMGALLMYKKIGFFPMKCYNKISRGSLKFEYGGQQNLRTSAMEVF
jgi:hypothetical protein